MTARILVVDDIPANVKLLEARLTAEYFDVTTAMSGAEALSICERAQCDIVLLDVMMPEMDGFEACRRLKANPATHHIPVVMVTALDQPSDRVRGLDAGADDFLTKPVSDIALLARVRSLVRLKMAADELRMRAVTSREIGINDPEFAAVNETGLKGRVLLVDDKRGSYERLAGILTAEHTVDVESNPQEALFHAAEADYECMIVSLGLDGFDGLRLCSQVRSLERTRGVPILMIAEAEDNARLLRGLEIGVNDYLVRPVDKNELLARVRTQIRRRRYTVRLRDNVQQSMEMAITDGLTGLYNRRYMESHLSTLVEQAAGRGKPLSLLVLDIDYFKSINDTHGHDAGDRHGRGGAGRGTHPPQDRGRAVRDRAGRQGDRRHAVDRACGARQRAGHRRHDPEARRPGALPRQARRPQPGGGGRGVSHRSSSRLSPTVIPAKRSESRRNGSWMALRCPRDGLRRVPGKP
jgi:two-component system cell cycle response regulator